MHNITIYNNLNITITDDHFKLSSKGCLIITLVKELTICFKNNTTLNVTLDYKRDKNIYKAVLLNHTNSIIRKYEPINSIEELNQEINKLKKLKKV